MKARALFCVLALTALSVGAATSSVAQESAADSRAGDEAQVQDPNPRAAEQPNRPRRFEPCVRGMAGRFPCHRVDLLSFFRMEEIGGSTEVGQGRGSDVWGWKDPQTGSEYVLAGRENGTAIVDITDPLRPVYLANLPTSAIDNRIWRDIKVYANHAFIVSESFLHGMQVLDLTRLRDIDPAEAPVTLDEDALYKEFETAHNIVINEDSGFAYAVGTRNADRSLNCEGGLHMIDIRDPLNPRFAGCFEDEGYIHDAHCVIYHGADTRYTGREICVASSPHTHEGNAVSIVDVTDKTEPELVGRATYAPFSAFSHQGWLTEDHRYYLHGDEGDELSFGHNTRTYTFDMADLTAPTLIDFYESSEPATDHNMYVKKRHLYQSNYRAGLRVLDLRNVADGQLGEVGFFDVYPPNNDPGFGFGSWSNYPFFDRGVVAVHGYQGLWLVRPRVGPR
ncbi:MAG: choice-of-anchor B family protein [Actinomycetota bacterium]